MPKLAPNSLGELPAAPTVKLNGGAPVPGVTKGRLKELLIVAVTGALALVGTNVFGITVMLVDRNLEMSLFDIAVIVTFRLEARVPVGGV